MQHTAINRIKGFLDILTYDVDTTEEEKADIANSMLKVKNTFSKVAGSSKLSNNKKILAIIGAVIIMLPLDMIELPAGVATFIDDAVVLWYLYNSIAGKKISRNEVKRE